MELSVFLTLAFRLRMDVVVGSKPPAPPPTMAPEPDADEWWCCSAFRDADDLSGIPLLHEDEVAAGAIPGW